MWMRSSPIEPGQTVVVLGQGIVGALCAQIVWERDPGRVIVVDAQPLRCDIARKLGHENVIDVSQTDSIAAVKELTDGKGADLVVECVGGYAGIQSFEQAQKMLAPRGTIHLIAKYQGAPLPLEGDAFMNKQIIAGIRIDTPREACMRDAAQMLIDGRIKVAELITHRLPWEQTPDAYHLLYHKPGRSTRRHSGVGLIGSRTGDAMKKLRLAVVGCGAYESSRARGYIATMVKLTDLYDLCAICDHSEQSLRVVGERFGIDARYTDFEAMLDGEKPDVVFILVPTDGQAVMALTAVERGCHIITEIPYAHTLAIGDAIDRACRDRGVVWEVAENVWLWPQGTIKAKDCEGRIAWEADTCASVVHVWKLSRDQRG